MKSNVVVRSLENSEVAPILRQYYKSHKVEQGHILVCHYENGQISKLIDYLGSSWDKILFVQNLRSGYYDLEGTTFLYEITCRKCQSPEISLYTMKEGALRLLFMHSMTELEMSDTKQSYVSFIESPAKVVLEIVRHDDQTLLTVINAQNGTLLSETNASIAKDPVEKFFAYLHSPLDVYVPICELLELFCRSKTYRSRIVQKLRLSPKSIEPLLKLRFLLWKEQAPEAHKTFVEELFMHTVGAKVQLSFDEDVLEERFTPSGPISFTSLRDGRLFYDTYENFVSHPRPLHRLHSFFYDLFGLYRFKNFTLVQDYEHASWPHILLSAVGEHNDERMIGCALCTADSFADDIATLTDGMLQAKKGYFNRLILHLVDAGIVEYTKCIEDERAKLRQARVEKIVIRSGKRLFEVKNILGRKLETKELSEDNKASISPLSKIEQRELQIISKGAVWAYRIPLLIESLAEEFRHKQLASAEKARFSGFIELDLDHSKTVIHPTTGSIDYNYGELMPVDRPIGQNEAGVVIGIKTDDLGLGYPVKRLLIIGDLSHASRGAIRGQECIRINAAIRYAAREKIPIDWFAASYGVQIHRERGVEGLDAAASTLREIVDNCHHKGLQINFIINETNIGAQSYWDSMGAIIHDTSGIIIMTPGGSMALTGPKSLACALYSTVPSEKIGSYTDALYPEGLQSLSGYRRVHGPNGDSTLFAETLSDAIRGLLLHHYYGYLKTNEHLAQKRRSYFEYIPAIDEQESLQKEMDNFLKGLKPNRMSILNYLHDYGSPQALQFWQDAKGIQKQLPQNGDLPQEASTIVEEMLIGGYPTLVIFTPTGPLTPADANIISRAIYKANSRMQVLIIGSLSGFSCDPLSMENRQLLEGAFIAKAIVEHKGPIVICNLGSLVGGTFAVFNKQLNKDLRIIAIEGARVQVIGGKSAAKVVFHSSICKQADQDSRVVQAIQKIAKRSLEEKAEVSHELRSKVISEIEEREGLLFDKFHNAQRAMKVKSIDQIASFTSLKEAIISNFEELRISCLNEDEHFESAA